MGKNERGMTLIEILATLILISIICVAIWSTISIVTKNNVGEVTSLRLQQEANYIITSLQQVHRKCANYNLSITSTKVEVSECKDSSGNGLPSFNSIVSEGYQYSPNIDDMEVESSTDDIDLSPLIVTDQLNKKREVKIKTVISRIKTQKGVDLNE